MQIKLAARTFGSVQPYQPEEDCSFSMFESIAYCNQAMIFLVNINIIAALVVENSSASLCLLCILPSCSHNWCALNNNTIITFFISQLSGRERSLPRNGWRNHRAFLVMLRWAKVQFDGYLPTEPTMDCAGKSAPPSSLYAFNIRPEGIPLSNPCTFVASLLACETSWPTSDSVRRIQGPLNLA